MNAENRLDLAWIRSQFPALSLEVGGSPAVFLDAPGGTQVPKGVVDAVSDALINANANIHGAFLTSQRTDQIIAAARQAAADFLGCDADEAVFGPNMTSLTFSLSRALGRELKPGDEIVLTYLDHDANFAPWKALEEAGAVIRVADLRREDCTLDIDQLLGLINDKTKIVAVGYASNSVGSINDVARIAAVAKAVGAWSFIDAVHYAPHGPIDVRAIGCDFLACSAYKFFGPHQGILYGRRELLEGPAALQGPSGQRRDSLALGNRHPESRSHGRRHDRRGLPRRTRRTLRRDRPPPPASPNGDAGDQRL